MTPPLEYNWPLVIGIGIFTTILVIIVRILGKQGKINTETTDNEWIKAILKSMKDNHWLWNIPLILAITLGIPTIIIGGMPKEVCCCSCDPTNLTACQADLSEETTQYILKPIIWPKKCIDLCSEREMNLTGTMTYEKWKETYLEFNYTEGFHLVNP
jgi:hypothetical protein